MENESVKRILTPEVERELLACLPFEEGESVEVSLSSFSKLPEEVKPYFSLAALSFEQRKIAARELVSKDGLTLETMTKILQEGVLTGWRNWRTRTRPVVEYSKDEIGKLDHQIRSALFWKAFSFNEPNVLEREGLG
jgi:hypothetical protein